MKKTLNILLIIIISLHINNSHAQIKTMGIPYIKNYSPNEYKAHGQNWAIIQDHRGIMYFANNQGVLEFDGVNWRLIETSNTATKSLAINDDNLIYVGAKGDLGYLQPDSIGTLRFQSLKHKIPQEHSSFADVWQILITKNEGTIFQTTNGLYIYKNDTFTVLNTKGEEGISLMFYINNTVYLDYTTKGLVKLKNGKLSLVKGTEMFAYTPIRALIPKSNGFLILTYSQGSYLYSNGEVTELKTQIDDDIYKELYKSFKLENKYYTFGLISKGLLITDEKLNPIKSISTANGLQDNRIHAIYQDNHKGIWLALSNGISYIDIFSPFSNYVGEVYGITGTVRTAMLYNNKLYIGADGLYVIDWKKEKENTLNSAGFKEVRNPKGNFSIWKLDTLNNKIYGSCETGLFKVVGDSIINIDKNKRRNVRTFVLLKGKSSHIVAGGGTGLSLYEFKNNQWSYKTHIEGFSEYCRHIAEDDSGSIWMSDKSKGVFKIRLNDSHDSVKFYQKYDTLNGLPSKYNNYLLETKNEIFFGTEDGIYRYDYSSDSFIPYNKLNKAMGIKRTIQSLHQDINDNIWFKEVIYNPKDETTSWELKLLETTKDSNHVISTPFFPYRNEIHSFSEVGDGSFIIGNKDGFVHYQKNIKKNFNHVYKTYIRSVEIIVNDSLIFGGSFVNDSNLVIDNQSQTAIFELPYEFNGLRFTFAPRFYEYPKKIQYKFYLEGNDKTWSDWKVEHVKEYSNLSPGTYTFHVKAINIYQNESEIATFTFKILPPWYLSVWAFIIYGILFILFILGIVKFQTRRLIKEKERLERIVKERTAEIRQQKEEIEAQRDELELSRNRLEEQNIEIVHKNEEITLKNEEITLKNKSITDSINYAKRIQEAMLPLESKIEKVFPDYFILFKPRDIVSGDFYWFAEHNNKLIFTAVDCTGHGVPGAFMSMIGAEILTTIVNKDITDAGEILTLKNQYIRTALKQETNENQDGMDMALCVIDKENKTVEFAGAKNPLVYIMNDELYQLKGDKQSIGGHQIFENPKFSKHKLKYESPAYFYMFSDGYPDQFGGEKNRKFMIKNLKNLIFEIHKKPMVEQKKILDEKIEKWMELTEQTDDILVIGFRI